MSRGSRYQRIGPEAYRAWRATSLGRVTEAIERRLVLELTGELGGRRVLDAGCGDGALLCAAARRGARAVGLDADARMLAAARARLAGARLDAGLVHGRIEQLPFREAAFDVVVTVTVLCFVPDAARAVREMARVLRPGGRLVIGALGRCSAWAAIRRVRGWLGSPTWRRARFRSAAELSALAESAGLAVAEMRGAVYYPPIDWLARRMVRLDPRLGRLTTCGAGFIALAAHRPGAARRTAPPSPAGP
jgi:SAM-dependent methyltransferase